jgi:NAD(P)-dependent dehydrogenase (short-subunit alcohol dehydrogenase family)
LIDRLPLQRGSEPEEIAAAVISLIDNPSITGQILAVDGGYQLI